MDIRLKRAYEPAAPSDGYRVLIDRLWPRGVSRERARLDEWDQELPPSKRLREWFRHEPDRFKEFRRRYIEELRGQRSRSQCSGGGLARVRSPSFTPPGIPSTTTPSSSPKSCAADCRGPRKRSSPW
jgi:uncharacterized protein YeaO (DUF488 family)